MLAVSRHPNQGVLHLVFRQSGARTVLQDCYARVPLRVLRSLYLDNTGTAYIYMLNPCGGVLGGDTYTITATVEAGAQAYLTTPGATKLYATRTVAARQDITLTVHDGAVLTYLPEQTIPFADAALQQHIRVRLGRRAYAFIGDILAPGRLARAEVFAYRAYNASLRVEALDGELCLLERLCLQPAQQPLAGLGLLEGYFYLGTLYALWRDIALPATLLTDLHDLLAGRQGLSGGATALPDGGIAVRWLAMNHTAARRALHDVWDTLRQRLLGYHAAPCRTL